MNDSTISPILELAEHEPHFQSPPVCGLEMIVANETQLAAIDLYQRGLNVFPLVRATKDKHFGQWARLQTTRLWGPDTGKDENERSERLEIFLRLFDDANIAVMCGRTSSNLTVLDCESIEVANHYNAEFAKYDLHPWVVRTGRGLHFWWLSDVVIANNPDDKDKPRHWEMRGHSCYVLCPPSVHPTGAVYEWVEREGETPPVIPISKLEWLQIAPLTKRRERLPFDDNPFARLFKSTRDFIEGGAKIGTRNDQLFRAACDFVAKGFRLNDAAPYLMHGCEQSGFDKSFTRRQADKTIASAYRKDRKSIKPTKPAPTWARAAAWAESHHWQALPYTHNNVTLRVCAQTAKRVFIACCERSRRDHADVFRAARREVSELAGIDAKTVTKAFQALIGAGYLLPRETNQHNARLFVFPKTVQLSPNNKEWFNSIGGNLHDGLKADVFSAHRGERKGLADTTGRVWKLILDKSMTTKQIAARLICDVTTVRRALKRLTEHNLVRRVGKNKWIGEKADDEHLKLIARTCNVLGRSQERKDKHSEERAHFVTMQFLHRKNEYERVEDHRARLKEISVHAPVMLGK